MKIITIAVLLLSAAGLTFSGDRNFTYTYQSSVLAKGHKEIEIWTTARVGRDLPFYSAIDNRMEFEVGLTNKLQSSFYLNFGNETQDGGSGKTSKFLFEGISSEWKYQFSNPYTNNFGFALYTELGLNTDEIELEGKIIIDKKINKTSIALNLSAENEWVFSSSKTLTELKLETNFGLTHSLSNTLSVGFELRNLNEIVEGELENSILFGGPAISYNTTGLWATLTLMPQLTALKGKTGSGNRNLKDFEKFESRLIFSLQI